MLDFSSAPLFPVKERVKFALISGLLATGIFLIDLQFPRGVAIGLLYITVVLISLKSPLPQDTIYSALLASTFSIIDYVFSAPAVPASISLINRTLYLATIWTTAIICLMRKKSERERHELQRFILEESERENKQALSLPLTKFLSTLLRLGILSKVLKDDALSEDQRGSSDIAKVLDHVDQAIGHARQLTDGLNAVPVDSSDLVAALRQLALDMEATSSAKCHFQCDSVVAHLTPGKILHIYRVIQAALKNAVQHRKATNVTTRLEQTVDGYRITIKDDGAKSDGMESEGAAVFQAMKYRAEMAGVSFQSENKKGDGVSIILTIPS